MYAEVVDLIGRFLIAVLFFASSVGHLTNWEDTLNECRRVHMPFAPVGLILFTILAIVGGLMILLGVYASIGAIVLAVFVSYAVFSFFPFWRKQGEEKLNMAKEFFNRMAVVGGLLILAAHGTGAWSLDRYLGMAGTS